MSFFHEFNIKMVFYYPPLLRVKIPCLACLIDKNLLDIVDFFILLSPHNFLSHHKLNKELRNLKLPNP